MFDDLDVAPGAQTGVTLAEELVPVGDAAKHLANMDKVELIGGVGPGQSQIVNFKDAVWGNKGGLDGGEVDTGDFGAGIFVGHITARHQSALQHLKRPTGNVHGPYPGAGADVEDFLRILQGGEMEFAIEGQIIHVMGDILLFVGDFIVGALDRSPDQF